MSNGANFYNLIDINPTDSINKYLLTILSNSPLKDLDVESFEGIENLSKPFSYKIRFTSAIKDIPRGSILNSSARFQFRAPNHNWSKYFPGEDRWIIEREFVGVITSFSLINTTANESLYEVTLEHKLALLDRRKRCAIYLNTSVVDLVTQILKEHHFVGYEIDFDNLAHTYPDREMIVQWDESDLQFIRRLLSEIGVWFRFENHKDNPDIIVMVFSDSGHRNIFDQKIAHASDAGLSSNAYSIDKLIVRHNVVSADVQVKDFDYRLSNSGILNADANVTGGDEAITYGKDYRYADIQHEVGSQYSDSGKGESSWFYAKLHHETLLNNQSLLSGISTSPIITPGMVLDISGKIPHAFSNGFVVTGMRVTGKRDSAYQSELIGIPYCERISFRPLPLPRPHISGTVPAIVTSTKDDDIYSHLDAQGRYWVKFDFDLDEQEKGYESMPVRLGRIYAGGTYGIHFPLIQGTEVAIAFEGGDPERPFIAHALHHQPNPDLVTNRNNTRNVIRTAGLNKLRMEDKRKQEHIKLSTEYAKSQLNLGHLVDASDRQRGEGAELRTDDRAVVRAAKGIMLTTEPQPRANGKQLAMDVVVQQLQAALSLAASLQQSAQTAQAFDVDTGPQQRLNDVLNQLTKPGLVAYADKGIAHVTPETLALTAGKDISINASANSSFNVLKKLSIAVGEGLSLFSRAIGIRMIAAKDDINIQAQRGKLGMLSDKDMHIQSVNGVMTLSSKKAIQLMCGGGGLRINEDGSVNIFSPKIVEVKSAQFMYDAAESKTDSFPLFKEEQFNKRFRICGSDDPEDICKNTKFKITKSTGEVIEGVTDGNGLTPLLDMTDMNNMNMEIFHHD